MPTWVHKLPFRLLGLLVAIVLGAWVVVIIFNSCVSKVETRPPADTAPAAEPASQETVQALSQVVVKLHDRIKVLEAEQAADDTTVITTDGVVFNSLMKALMKLDDRIEAVEAQQTRNDTRSQSPSKNAADGPEFDDPEDVSPVLSASVRRLNQQKAWSARNLDCSHFDSWESAQAFYEMRFELTREAWLKGERPGDRPVKVFDARDPWDVYNLDSDRDGVACEALR